jgi:hypothetical protein
VELGGSPGRVQGSLSVAAPSTVFTIARVAKMLGEDQAFLQEVASEMEPEDGCLWICDVDDEHDVIGFTLFGIESLKELIEIHKDQRTPPPRE